MYVIFAINLVEIKCRAHIVIIHLKIRLQKCSNGISLKHFDDDQ